MNLSRTIAPGEVLEYIVYQTPLADLSAVPLTLILDSQNGNSRFILRHLNGGTDGVLIEDDEKVRFTRLPAWTAANLTGGKWDVLLLRGTHATDQVLIGQGILTVTQPRGGALPVAGV
jgi:hypothetical protein